MKDPSVTSSDYQEMSEYWDMINSIWGGVKTMRKAGNVYLPKFPDESKGDYEFRRDNSRFTNIFKDIVENLAAKPFAKELSLDEKTSGTAISGLMENIDGSGSHINTFASRVFLKGISHAIHWILVDYTKGIPENASVADEKELGVRPYWVSIPAENVIAAYSVMVGGKEQFYHVRISENVVEVEVGIEVNLERVRIFNREPILGVGGKIESLGPPTWKVMEKEGDNWSVVESGELTIDEIPLVPFVTGMRDGCSWQVDPVMRSAADLQISLFQDENGLKYAKDNTAFSMVAGNGISPPVDKDNKPLPARVGPRTVLYAPPDGNGNHGEWKIIEPTAANLKFLGDDIQGTIKELRELGRQPLTAQTGNLTVITTAFAAQKGNSAIQQWAINLKDALENALLFTAMWLKEKDTSPEVNIHTEFDVGSKSEEKAKNLIEMRKLRDISRESFLQEMQKIDVLPNDFDHEENDNQLDDEEYGSVEDPIEPEPVE